MRAKRGWLSLVVALSACAAPSAPAGQTLSIDVIGAEPGRLTFGGATTLPAEHCLLTQLIINGAVAPDWPVECVYPAAGAWQLSVAVGKRGEPPAPKAGVTYEFLIWARDLPTVSARRPADIAPLP